MLKKLNIRYAVVLAVVLVVEIMILYGSNYRETYHDSQPILTYKETAEKGYAEWLKYLKTEADRTRQQAGNRKGPSALERQLRDSGLVNVQDIDPDIMVGLRYSSRNNFMGKDLYGDLDNCYLQKEAAEKLALASKYLHEKCSFYNLKVLDGVRPLHIQRVMWDSLKMPAGEKQKYVSPPSYGSLHNYGVAVDITLVNYEGWEVDMGTDFDYFGELGHPSAEGKLVSEGKLTYRQIENRKLLREAMYKAGFTGLGTEWWHFNACSIEEARSKYHIVE
jgi:D-alanyl-D-alanine dipeptidase